VIYSYHTIQRNAGHSINSDCPANYIFIYSRYNIQGLSTSKRHETNIYERNDVILYSIKFSDLKFRQR